MQNGLWSFLFLAVMSASLSVHSQTPPTLPEIPANSGPIIIQPKKYKRKTNVTPPKAPENKAAVKSTRSSTSSGAPSSEIKDVDSTLDPGEEVVRAIDSGNSAVKKVRDRDDHCDVCELKNTYSTGNDSIGDQVYRKFKNKDANQEGTLVPPRRDNNPATSGRSAMCGSRDGGYDVCISNGDTTPTSFKFSSTSGGNTREWDFVYENDARQDLGFFISDVPSNGSNSHTKETYMMVFPRKYVPSIRVAGGKQTVTLPTGEAVTYDATSKKITGGVLSEDKTYSGEGVSVRADGTGEDPRYGKSKNATATVSKKGKTCKVPKKDLWPDQSQTSALHFKFAGDAEFDSYLKKKCGFGL